MNICSLEPVLQRGNQGYSVKGLQYLLNQLGANLVLDGKFGGQTEAAVRHFQDAYQLPVNGVVGTETWRSLIQAELDASKPQILSQRSVSRRYQLN